MKRALYIHIAMVIFLLMASGGLETVSVRPATTNPQFATGPQKWVVLRPVGLFTKAFNLRASPPLCLTALIFIFWEDVVVFVFQPFYGVFEALFPPMKRTHTPSY